MDKRESRKAIRRKQAVKFLNRLGLKNRVLCAFDPAVDSGPPIESITCDNPEQAAKFINYHDGKNNLYWTTGLTRKRLNRKPAETDIGAVQLCHVEIDPTGDGVDVAEIKTAIHARLKTFEPAPSVMYESGNGVQCLWMLAEPVVIDPDNQAEEIAAMKAFNVGLRDKINEHLAGIECKPDKVQNTERLLRIPHTVNIPTPGKLRKGRKRQLAGNVEFHDATYTTADLPKGAVVHTVPLKMGATHHVDDLDALEIPERLKKRIVEGEPIGGRNEAVFDVVRSLKRLGIPPETIVGILTNEEWRIGHKWKWNEDKARTDVVRILGKSPLNDDVAQKLLPEDDDDTEDDGSEFESPTNRKLTVDTEAGTVSIGGLKGQLLSSVPAEIIDWYWRNRLPAGKLVLVAGFPDVGKSQVVLSICAIASRGAAWPNDEGFAEQGATIYFSAEDTPNDVIKPRFLANGGDDDQFLHMRNEVSKKNAKRTFNIKDDLKALTEIITWMRDTGRNVRIVVLDPINAYFGGKEAGDAHKNSDMRHILTPLNDWAHEQGVLVIGITHFKKGFDANVLYRIVDSMAISAQSRAAWICGIDGEGDDARYVFTQAKKNLGEAPSLEYVFEEVKDVEVDSKGNWIDAPRIEWKGRIDITAEKLTRTLKDREKRTHARDYAVSWLQEFLLDGPRKADDVFEIGKAQGHTVHSLKMAKHDLDVEAKRQGFGDNGTWYWMLPGHTLPKAADDGSEFG